LVYCWKCANELRDDAAFCPKCGASVRGTGTMGVQPRTGLERLADDRTVQDHWIKRLIALVIDGVIVSVAFLAIALIAAIPLLLSFPYSTGSFPGWWFGWWGFGSIGVVWLLIFLYFFLAEGLYARTIGKEIMGLRVERVDGKRVSFRDSFVRNLSKIYWVLLLLDVAVGLATHGDMSQKWSDRYAGTKVEANTRMTIIS
jgi:uncharacterized RDD family membrane protein YckC